MGHDRSVVTKGHNRIEQVNMGHDDHQGSQYDRAGQQEAQWITDGYNMLSKDT